MWSSVLDENKKFEPTVFWDMIVLGLNEVGNDLDALAKFLDVTGSRLDYRRYADILFDILIAGSMLGEFHCDCLTDWAGLITRFFFAQINTNISGWLQVLGALWVWENAIL